MGESRYGACMRELFIVGAIVVFLVMLGVIPLIDLEPAVSLGTTLLVVGFGIGLPASSVYHVLLRNALTRRQALSKGWYWDPMRYHHLVPPGPRRVIERWFFAGGAGFVILVLGVVIIVISMLVELRSYM